MGITVVSSSSVPAAAASNTLSASTPDTTGGFAALLSGQLGNAIGNILAATQGTDKAQTAVSADEKDVAQEESLTDPTLAMLMGIPPITPPVQPTTSIKFDASLSSQEEGTVDSASILGNLGSEGKTGLTENRANSLLQSLGLASETAAAAAKSADQLGETANLAAEASNSSTGQAASQLAAAGNHLSGATAAAQAQEKTEVSTPLHSANWNQDFSEKIVWLAKNDQQSAQININPPQLGPVQITLQINGDQASAVFASPHAEVRQAIENSLPQLKEMLSAAGINLGQSDVGANLAQQNRDTPFQAPNENRSASENAILPASGNSLESTASQPIQRGRGLVDLFA